MAERSSFAGEGGGRARLPRVNPAALGTSVSMPHMKRPPPHKEEPLVSLPRMEAGQLPPRPSGRGPAKGPRADVSNWPAGSAHGGQHRPDALAEIEQFLSAELQGLSTSPEVRLQPHVEAFDLFISHFGLYSGPLSMIKRAYEARISQLEKSLSRSS